MAAPTTTSTALPSGISRPWASIGANGQNGLVAVLEGVAVSFVVVSLLIRIFARHNFAAYRADDYTFLVAVVFAFAQAGVVFHQVKLGLGKPEDLIQPQHVESLQKAAYASDILYLLTIFLCKVSTCFLFTYLTPSRHHLIAIWSILALSVAWALSSIFMIAIRCHPRAPWLDNSTASCPDMFTRWLAVAALDIATEVLLVAMSIYLIWGIQMPLSAKLIVVGAFSCRLPTLAPIILRLHYLHPTLTPSSSTFYTASRTAGCTALHIGYTVIATIIPYLKPFMSAYDVPAASAYYNVSTTSISASRSGTGSQYGDGGKEGAGEYVLEDRGSRVGIGQMEGNERVRLRPEEVVFEASCEGGGERGRASWDGASGAMIIKKGVEWSVVRERRRSSGILD